MGKKKIKKEVHGAIIDIIMGGEEEDDDYFLKKPNNPDNYYDNEGTFEEANFFFEFESEDMECGDLLDEKTIEAFAFPQDQRRYSVKISGKLRTYLGTDV